MNLSKLHQENDDFRRKIIVLTEETRKITEYEHVQVKLTN